MRDEIIKRGKKFIKSEKEFFCREKNFKEKVQKLLREKKTREIERRKRNKYM